MTEVPVRPHLPILRLIVGPVGSGKTTFARDWARDQTLAGRTVVGVLARKTPEGRVFHDLATGDETPIEHPGPGETAVAVGRFLFRRDAFDWAVTRIEAGVAAGCDAVVIDEVGPIEMRGEGFADLLDRLADWPGERVLLVRDGLADPVRMRFGADVEDAAVIRQDVS